MSRKNKGSPTWGESGTPFRKPGKCENARPQTFSIDRDGTTRQSCSGHCDAKNANACISGCCTILTAIAKILWSILTRFRSGAGISPTKHCARLDRAVQYRPFARRRGRCGCGCVAHARYVLQATLLREISRTTRCEELRDKGRLRAFAGQTGLYGRPTRQLTLGKIEGNQYVHGVLYPASCTVFKRLQLHCSRTRSQ